MAETPTAERCFSDHLPLGMIELDSQTIYHLNQTLRGWLQLRNVPPLPQRWEAVFPPALLRELEPLMQAVAAGSREQRLTWKERTLQLEAASDLTADGHKLMIVHDISRYQAAVQAMQHTEERWRRALEVSGDGVGLCPQAGVEYLSDRLLAIYGYDRADLESDPEERDRRTHPDDLAEMRSPRSHFSARRRCTSTNTGYRVKTAAGNGC
jgi:PAS domain-containing protein